MLFSQSLFADSPCPLKHQCIRPYCQFSHTLTHDQSSVTIDHAIPNDNSNVTDDFLPECSSAGAKYHIIPEEPVQIKHTIDQKMILNKVNEDLIKRQSKINFTEDINDDPPLMEYPAKYLKLTGNERIPNINGGIQSTISRNSRLRSPKRVAHSAANRINAPVHPISRTITTQQQLMDRYIFTTKPDSASDLTTAKRLAHTPNHTVLSFTPLAITSGQCRLPNEFRRPFIKKLYDEFRKVGKEDSLQLAKQEELTIADQVSSLNAYRNNVAKAVVRIRHCRKDTMNEKANLEQDIHQQQLSLKAALQTPLKRLQIEDLAESDLYELLVKYILNEEDLKKYGFPRPGINITEVTIRRNPYWCSKLNDTSGRDPSLRTCDRCSREFKVDSNEYPIQVEQCIYHWGKLRQVKSTKRYNCCGAENNSIGCTSAKVHVVRGGDISKNMMGGFVYTIPKAMQIKKNISGIFALDCEMCYTTKGLEVTRVTVVNHKRKSVYESFVIPDNPIIDYNTRWSGVSECHLSGIKTRLADVRTALNQIISDKSIIIGHGLENDLIGLKLIHNVIIDTSIMFPHRLGYPYKRSLKDLLCEKLNKIIQDSSNGHSSQEDAIACMDLVYWKVKQDLRSSSSTLLAQILG